MLGKFLIENYSVQSFDKRSLFQLGLMITWVFVL